MCVFWTAPTSKEKSSTLAPRAIMWSRPSSCDPRPEPRISAPSTSSRSSSLSLCGLSLPFEASAKEAARKNAFSTLCRGIRQRMRAATGGIPGSKFLVRLPPSRPRSNRSAPPKSCRSSPLRLLLFRNSGNHCKPSPSTANNRQRLRSGHLPHFTTALKAIGMMRMARMFTTLIIGFTAGPAVSLYGSPTVSPVTAA